MIANTAIQHLVTLWRDHKLAWVCCIAFALPLKLLIAHCLLIPAILAWLMSASAKPGAKFPEIMKPTWLLLAAMVVSIPFGVNLFRSLDGALSFALFSLTIAMVADAARDDTRWQVLKALIAGQTIAAIHSVYDAAYSPLIPRFFISRISESGQLCLTILAAAGLALFAYAELRAQRDSTACDRRRLLFATMSGGGAAFALAICLSLSATVPVIAEARGILAGVGFAVSFLAVRGLYRALAESADARAAMITLVTFVAPLLCAAMVINLKRGPWLGVSVALFLLLVMYARVVVVPLLCAAGVLIAAVPALQLRILRASTDFVTAGGRGSIWDVGFELLQRYPLGVGYDNARVLREFSHEIPRTLTHFHNNFLNIAVELGWIGVMVFLWWIVSILFMGWRAAPGRSEQVVFRALTLGVLGLQVAGLVEYNFGDSEVLIVAFLVVGVIAGGAERFQAALKK